MGILSFLSVATSAAKVERIVAKRLGILPIQMTKGQKSAIIDATHQGRQVGMKSDQIADMCFELVEARGRLDRLD